MKHMIKWMSQKNKKKRLKEIKSFKIIKEPESKLRY